MGPGIGPSLDPSWSVDNARLRAEVVLRTVPPPEDDQLSWRFAVHMVANDSLVMAAEIERLREAIASAYHELRRVDYGGEAFEQVAPVETALGRIVEKTP